MEVTPHYFWTTLYPIIVTQEAVNTCQVIIDLFRVAITKVNSTHDHYAVDCSNYMYVTGCITTMPKRQELFLHHFPNRKPLSRQSINSGRLFCLGRGARSWMTSVTKPLPLATV